ncbi:Acid protease [Tenacibaculum litopenaei]|jgi:hypothetical protein|uniref:retropepsin-like aspartic protease n=1 Tax=Tenacibaculum litopenaei TaxID=396016 RepID=UPI0038966EC8
MASLKKVLKKKKYLKVKLKKIATNHLELKAKINGVKGRFILDTGASISCVGIDQISYFNLITEDSDLKAAGAGAIDMLTKRSSSNEIQLGKWKIDSCDLVLLDLGHINTVLKQSEAKEVHGIIGADLLESGKAFIDYGEKCLYLKKVKRKKLKKLPF